MKDNDGRKLSPSAQEDLRKRVVAAIAEQGIRQTEAVRAFNVSRTAVYNWLQAFKRKGKTGLKGKKRGRKKRSRLAGYQAATTVRMITDRCPDQLKLPFALWTRDAVRQLIADRFETFVSVWTVGRYLRKWGFTPQKPLKRAYERNPEAVEKWLNKEYPAIRKKARKEGAEVHWGDEMGMRSDHQTGLTYGIKGKTPILVGTGRRFSINMISTVTNRGRLSFMIFKERFTAPKVIEFLRRLIKTIKRKVFIIWDKHPVHRSKKVKDWLYKNRDKIEAYFLPSYCPDLNPDELLNQDVKSNAVGRRRAKTITEMTTNARSYLRSTQKQPNIVRSYFKEDNVRYAAE